MTQSEHIWKQYSRLQFSKAEEEEARGESGKAAQDAREKVLVFSSFRILLLVDPKTQNNSFESSTYLTEAMKLLLVEFPQACLFVV